MKKELIEYGGFRNDEWKTLNGLNSVNYILNRIKSEINWTGYELWIHGSILNDVDTHDIDLTILGPINPKKINKLLESCIAIGFQMKTYVDINYSLSNELYNPVNDDAKEIIYACYRPKISIGGTTYDYGRKVNDLYLKSTKWPLTKTIGKQMKAPMKLI